LVAGTFGTLDYTPIHYIDQRILADELCALYVLADICLVTSVRDGMNLVSHEYILSQSHESIGFKGRMPRSVHPGGPGVLVLSEFAGGAQSLNGAVSAHA
jgi:trehalose-6-phosphate synthase